MHRKKIACIACMATNTTQSKYLNLYFDRREKARRRIFWWHTTHTFMTLFKSMSDIFMSLFSPALSRASPEAFAPDSLRNHSRSDVLNYSPAVAFFFYFVAPCHRIPLILVICDTSECVCVSSPALRAHRTS